MDLSVLVPTDYATSGRAYPVLYLWHGAGGNRNTWLDRTDLETFTAPFTGGQGVIVVMPGGDPYFGSTYDWHSGRHLYETVLVDQVIPYIDGHFRTRADRSHRAIAGLSGGGASAMVMAAHHPDIFVAAGSFSGFPLDLGDTVTLALAPVPIADQSCQGGPPGYEDEYGSLTSAWFREASPSDLVANLGGMSLYVAAGTGVPCPNSDDAQTLVAGTAMGNPLVNIEPLVHRQSTRFDAALTAAGVPHTTDFPSCGIHTYPVFQRELHAFWPQMARAFGTPRPAAYTYRHVAPRFSVWGWSFGADPHRAPEFLEVGHASSAGLTLTGSGTEAVTTPPLFASGAVVDVGDGSHLTPVTAAADGRITFSVDLGSPHPNDQYSVEGQALQTLGGYFTTRRIVFATTSPALAAATPVRLPNTSTGLPGPAPVAIAAAAVMCLVRGRRRSDRERESVDGQSSVPATAP
jgi:S-formylglutathione hydrolase FrmB